MTNNSLILNKIQALGKKIIPDDGHLFLYGSQARGDYNEQSDWDLLILLNKDKTEFKEIVETYLSKFEFYHCFETPNMHWLDERMKEKGYRVCFMAEYFLPDMERLKRLECNYVLKVLEQKDFADLYLPMWGNALCADRKELDVLGVGAYDGEKLVGLAACSADCDNMWQIGVDVLPEYRRMGIASSLTSNLAIEIIERGKVPFYCCAWSNLKSVKNALRSGFVPGWVEMTVKAASLVDEMKVLKNFFKKH